MKSYLSILLWTLFLPLTFCQVDENFDNFSNGAYGNYTNIGTGGGWDVVNGLGESMAANVRGGSGRAVRLRNNGSPSLTYSSPDGAGKDNGIGTVSFWYRHWDGDSNGIDFNVEYNAGSGWVNIGSVTGLAGASSTTYTQFSASVDVPGDNILVRINVVDPGERLIIDDAIITDFTGPSCGVSLQAATYTCSSNTAGGNNDAVTILIPYTGSDAGITGVTTTSGGTIAGDDPSATPDGTIEITGLMEGSAWDIALQGGNCSSVSTTGTVPSSQCDPTSVEFTAATFDVNEDAGTINALVCVSITNASSTTATTVDVALTGGTASNGTDINTYSTQTLTFAAGSTSNECISLVIVDDTDDEPNESLEFTLQNPTGGNAATLGSVLTTTLTILDNDISCPNVGDLVISEIMQNPNAVGDDDGEYFEVYNPTGAAIDMQGMVIASGGGGNNDHTIGSSLTVPADGYVSLSLFAGSIGGFTADYSYGGTGINLSNGSDDLQLLCNSQIIDEVSWDDGATFPDPNGASMTLDPTLLDAVSNDNGANWCESTSNLGNGDLGTPGSTNDNCRLCVVNVGDIILPSSDELFDDTGKCDEVDGWTYYSPDGNAPYMFAINWAPDGSISTANQTAKDNVLIELVANSPQGVVIPGVEGTWTMERYWNIAQDNTFDEAVSIRFFYDPSQKTATTADATSSGISPVETPVWFKTTTSDFSTSLVSSTGIGGNAIDLTPNVVSDGNMLGGETYVEFENITSFSGGTWAAGAGTTGALNSLPVQFTDIQARPRSDKSVEISWGTAQEVNNNYFEVQHSIDGLDFTVIGQVEGAGSSNQTIQYSFNHFQPNAGVNYYRIAQVDYDGTTSYSNTVSVQVQSDLTVELRPTLVEHTLGYDVGEQPVKLILMSLDGSVYQDYKVEGQGYIDCSHLTPGIYTVTVVTGVESVTQRITKI